MSDEQPFVERRAHPQSCYMEPMIKEIRAKVFNGMKDDIMKAVTKLLREISVRVTREQALVIGMLVSILLGLVTFITIGRVEANASLVRESEITTTLKLLTQQLKFDERLLGIGADPIPATSARKP